MRDYLNEIASDPSASYWLRDAVRTTRGRDIVDAINDAETLVLALKRVWQANCVREAKRA
jgi:hypothetical protein